MVKIPIKETTIAGMEDSIRQKLSVLLKPSCRTYQGVANEVVKKKAQDVFKNSPFSGELHAFNSYLARCCSGSGL